MTVAAIGGGRDYVLGRRHFAWLDIMHAYYHFTEIVSGTANGADVGGEVWAKRRGLPIRRYAPDWATHGRKAGPMRNRMIAEYLAKTNGLSLLFPGGAGTADMERQALALGVGVLHFAAGPVKRKVQV